MEREEVDKHRAREQAIKAIAHLHNARHHLNKAFPRIRFIYSVDELASQAKNNCEVLSLGINETIQMLARLSAKIRVSIREPLRKPPPERGAHLDTKLTPKQRDLTSSGHLKLNTIPTTVSTPHRNPPKVVSYKPKVKTKTKPNPLDIPI